MPDLLPCERCGHSPTDHRIDDYGAKTDPTDPETPFRCVADECSCPDFVGPVFDDERPTGLEGYDYETEGLGGT